MPGAMPPAAPLPDDSCSWAMSPMAALEASPKPRAAPPSAAPLSAAPPSAAPPQAADSHTQPPQPPQTHRQNRQAFKRARVLEAAARAAPPPPRFTPLHTNSVLRDIAEERAEQSSKAKIR